MAVNLNMLDINIDQFNEAASGKHNIGQLKLGIGGSILDTLKAGGIKPLSAAEVREIDAPLNINALLGNND
jgi:hypothetical protein